MKEELIRMDHVNAESNLYGKIEDLSFCMTTGEIFSIFGLYQSGMNCIQEILTGSLSINKGEIRVSHKMLNVVVIDSKNRLFSNLNIRENIAVYLERQERKNKEKSELESLRDMQLHKSRNTMVSELSAIEKTQLLFSIALVRKSHLVIVNCVGCSYGVSDYEVLKNCILQLKEKGIGVLVLQEKPDPLTDIVERAAILKRGRIIKVIYEDVSERKLWEILRQMFSLRKYEVNIENPALKEKGSLGEIRVDDHLVLSLNAGKVIGMYDIQWGLNQCLPDYIHDVLIKAKGNAKLSRLLYKNKKCIYIPENSADILPANEEIASAIVQPSYQKIANKLGIINRKMMAYTRIEFLKKRKLTLDYKYVKDLDYLNKKILCIYRWVIQRPEVIILENPFLKIDVSDVQELNSYIQAISNKGICVIVSSKDVTDLFDSCDQIVLLDGKTIMKAYEREQFTQITVLLR